jgi:hypothetical protein
VPRVRLPLRFRGQEAPALLPAIEKAVRALPNPVRALARSSQLQAPQPGASEDWLETRADISRCTIAKTIRCEKADPATFGPILEAGLRTSDDLRQFVEIDGYAVHVIRVPSIAYSALPHLAACALFNAIDEVVLAETNIAAETWLDRV